MKELILLLTNIIRQPLWLIKGNRVSIRARICSGTMLRNCIIKPYAYIGRNCILNNVIVEEYCSIASNVSIGGMAHAYWDHSTSDFITTNNIGNQITHLAPDCWVASACVIKQGISLGFGSVIGANSFLNKDTEAFSIYVGSPARLLKYRFDNTVQEKIIATQYWTKRPHEAKRILKDI